MSGLNLICLVSRRLKMKYFAFFASDHSILIIFGKPGEFCWKGKLLIWRNQREGEAWMVKENAAVGFAPVNLICGYWYSCSVLLWRPDDYSVPSLPKCKQTLWSSQASIISLIKSGSCCRVCPSPRLALSSFSHGCTPRPLKFSIILGAPRDGN